MNLMLYRPPNVLRHVILEDYHFQPNNSTIINTKTQRVNDKLNSPALSFLCRSDTVCHKILYVRHSFDIGMYCILTL